MIRSVKETSVRSMATEVEYCHTTVEALHDADLCFIFTEWLGIYESIGRETVHL